MKITRKSIVWTTSFDDFQRLLNESSSIVEILKKLGFGGYNGNHRTIKKRIKEENFDLTLFTANKKNFKQEQAKKLSPINKRDNEDIFVENSSYVSGNNIKSRLLQDFGWKYECAECGNQGTYNNKPLSLQLDHINGINNDNRLSNLRFLCPNCHSQTLTFSGKRK